jgi:restriction endonuclease S subunit
LKLVEIADIRTGLVLSRKKAALSDEVKIHYKQITLKSFSNTTSLVTPYIDEFISTEEISDTYISRVGDVVVRLREPITAVYIDKDTEGLVVPSLMGIVRAKSNMVDSEFLAYYINSTTAQRMIGRETKGTTIPMIKTKDLEGIEVVLPSLERQERVVRLMKLSQKETELLDKLKREKKRLSQAVLDTIILQHKEEK